MPNKQTSYDAIPYPSNPFRQTRPERLSAIARLFDLETPAVENCRVLELGCSMGGNLMVIAQEHPESHCVGIDASSRQIADGWKTIDALGFKNIQLKHMDILDVGEDLGEFDYIISHGVFSWVPQRVQNKMLEICQRLLAPNGVAYISYNTYPGWHIRGVVRDMMFYRGMQFADPATQLAQAKGLVEFVAQSSRGSDTPYQRLLQSELKHLGKMEDYYLHHEHLEENNQPLYFHEMAKRLATNGLQYLGEADFSMMVSSNFSNDVAKTLHDLGAHDIIQMEQYMDFVRCRYFRKTLICRSGVKLNRAISSDVVKGFMLASDAVPEKEDPPLDPKEAVSFETRGGYKVNCKSPLTKLALLKLRAEWPMPIAFADLHDMCKAEAEAKGYPSEKQNTEDFLASELLTAMASGILEWQTTPVAFTTEVGKMPMAPPLARLQAADGYKVTSLRGELVTLDEFHRQTLLKLDGKTDLKTIADGLMESLRSGELVLQRDDNQTPVRDETEMRNVLGPALEKVLVNLAKKALLARTD